MRRYPLFGNRIDYAVRPRIFMVASDENADAEDVDAGVGDGT